MGALLVLVTFAGYHGLAAGVIAYTGQPGADLWVAPRGTDNLIRSSGLIPGHVVRDLGTLAGVAEAAPLLRGFVTASQGDTDRGITLLAMAWRAPDGPGGPPALAAGRAPHGPVEVVLDRAAAYRLGLGVGDPIFLNGRSLRVVGLSRDTNLLATQFVFLDVGGANAVVSYSGQASFVVLRLRPDADPAAVARAAHDRWDALVAWPPAAFVRNNLREVSQGFRPLQVLVISVGVLASAILVLLLVQALVQERRRDVAVLLALGAPLSGVAVAVLRHVTAVVLLGVATGAALAQVLAWGTDRWMPTLALAPRLGDVLVVALLYVAMALVAAAGPLLRLRRIDPVEAFRP